MNWQQTERPGIKRGSNVINDHVLKGMENAAHCARWLKSQGFVVLNVIVGRRNPRVEIQPSRLCRQLQGAIYMTERAANKPTVRYWAARYFGCEVRWAETGGAE